MTESLWGAISAENTIRTPHALLREQSIALKNITKGLLYGRIERKALSGGYGGQPPIFVSTFSILAPALNNYTYEVLSIEYPIDMYPVLLSQPTSDAHKSCADEAALVTALQAILSSERIVKLVQGLLAQIQSDT